MRWTVTDEDSTLCDETFMEIALRDDDPHALVRLLRAMQLSEPVPDRISVDITLCMDEAAIAALHNLPAWPVNLRPYECEWPLEPTAYEALGRAIPLTYTVRHGYAGAWPEEARVPRLVSESMRHGANDLRLSLGLPPLSSVQ